MIYLLTISCSLIISLFVQHPVYKSGSYLHGFRLKVDKGRVKRSILIILSALGPLVISVLRYGIGTDYFHTYIPEFNYIASYGKNRSYEIGFYLLNKFISIFTKDAQWLIAVTSILFIFLVYKEVYKEANYYTISLLIFFLSYSYFVSMNNIRQSLASAILLLATFALIHGKRIWFVVWVFLAGLIHQSAYILILMLLIEKLCCSALLYLVLSIIVMIVGRIVLPKIILIIAPYFLHLSSYLTLDIMSIYRKKTIGNTFIILNVLIMMVYVYLDLVDSSDKSNILFEKLEWNYAKLNQCIILCLCAFDGIVPAAYRVIRIFTFSQFIILPNVIGKYERNKRNKLILFVLIVFAFGISFLQDYMSGTEGVFPYVSIFD